jgi:TonB family protein
MESAAAPFTTCKISSSPKECTLGSVFISYRRSDSQGEAGRLFDDLVTHFGEDTVFMDVAAIEAGRDFRKAIEEGVTKCGVLLVMIGLEWLDAKDDRGARRLNDPSDFVRIETAAALKRDIPVIPVLVRGAKMPSAEQLPDDLKELAYRNCIELTHARWKSDMQLLTVSLRRLLGDPTKVEKSARSNDASAPTQPASPQNETAVSSNLGGGSSARIDPAAVQSVTRELALHIGPIAGVVVKRAAAQCDSLQDLYLKVAQEIDSPAAREKFLRGRAPFPLTTALDVEKVVAIPATDSPRIHELPSPAAASTAGDVEARADGYVAEIHPPNRRKNLLSLTVGSAVLILLLVVTARFATKKDAHSSQPSQTSGQVANVSESRSVNSGAITPPAGMPSGTAAPIPSTAISAAAENQTGPARRVQVPEEVSKRLLIRPIAPAYPVLARQAHIQGQVVLDADISKDGRIETLKVISGDPRLIEAALDAAKKLRYKPYVRNGEAVAMNTRIVVGFTLSGG